VGIDSWLSENAKFPPAEKQEGSKKEDMGIDWSAREPAWVTRTKDYLANRNPDHAHEV